VSGIVITRSSSETWSGACPFCEEESLALSTHDHGGVSLFYCFGCGRSGSALITPDPMNANQAMASVRPIQTS
jgi:DNA primase